MSENYKKTILHHWHVEHGANMAPFGNYEMPLWYPTGAKNEHMAVLTAAGLFDTSHMAVLKVTGPDAFDLLQICFSKDLMACIGKSKTPLVPGRCVYGVFLNASGEVIDDAIVYHIAPEDYMVVVNSGMGPVITSHLTAHGQGRNAIVTDLTDQVGKIDIQGPASARILKTILKDPENVFEKMVYFSFKGYFNDKALPTDQVLLRDTTPILLSRTGYTGEFGFEIFVAPDRVLKLWEMILDAGSSMGIMACGLAARDSLRAGAVLPLSHQDIGPWRFVNHPWSFALPYTSDRSGFTKPFIGDSALKKADASEYTYPFAGYDLRKITDTHSAVVLDAKGREIGRVLTCVSDMAIGRYDDRIFSLVSPDRPQNFIPKGLSCGFVKVKTMLSPCQVVEIKDRRRKIKVMIVNDIRPDRTARRAIKEML